MWKSLFRSLLWIRLKRCEEEEKSLVIELKDLVAQFFHALNLIIPDGVSDYFKWLAQNHKENRSIHIYKAATMP